MPLITTSMLEGRDFEGGEYGASVSLILTESDPGDGPRLHRHPYDETWVVQEGTLRFELGDERFTAGPGDIVAAPAGVRQKFTNRGPAGRNSSASTPAQPSPESGSNETRRSSKEASTRLEVRTLLSAEHVLAEIWSLSESAAGRERMAPVRPFSVSDSRLRMEH